MEALMQLEVFKHLKALEIVEEALGPKAIIVFLVQDSHVINLVQLAYNIQSYFEYVFFPFYANSVHLDYYALNKWHNIHNNILA